MPALIYNHLYFSDLPRAVVRDYAAGGEFWTALDHRNFSPRVVEQVLRRPHTAAAGLASELAQALDRPVELWGPSFEHGLSDLARELLLTLVTFPPDGVSRAQLLAACALRAPSLPTNQAFRALEDTWVRLTGSGAKMTVAFADPSCRDYVLAYLDDNPDEAGRLLLTARTADQAVLLLRYASSSSAVVAGGRAAPAHLGLRSAVKERAADVVAHLDRLYPRAVAAAQDYRPLERLLAAVLSSRASLGAAGVKWVDDRVVELSCLSLPEDGRDADSLAHLILHLAGRHASCRGRTRRDALARAVAALSLALAREAETESEFETFSSVADDQDAGPLVDPAAAGVVVTQVADYVRQQLEDLEQDYEDPDDMTQRVNELRQLAGEHGADDDVRGDLTAAARRIEEQETYGPEEDESPDEPARAFATPDGGGYASAADAKRRQDDWILGLFRNLMR